MHVRRLVFRNVVFVEFFLLLIDLAYDELGAAVVVVNRMLHQEAIVALLLFLYLLDFDWLVLRAGDDPIDLILTAAVSNLLFDFFELADEQFLHGRARQVVLSLLSLSAVLVDDELKLLLRSGKALLRPRCHQAAGLQGARYAA